MGKQNRNRRDKNSRRQPNYSTGRYKRYTTSTNIDPNADTANTANANIANADANIANADVNIVDNFDSEAVVNDTVDNANNSSIKVTVELSGCGGCNGYNSTVNMDKPYVYRPALTAEYMGVDPSTRNLQKLRYANRKVVYTWKRGRYARAGHISNREGMASLDRPVCVNLTKHDITPEMYNDPDFIVISFEGAEWATLQELQDFDHLPSIAELYERATKLATMAANTRAKYAWIAGAPYLMRPLEESLLKKGITPCYSYSYRNFKDIIDPVTGKVREVRDFRHIGWIIPNQNNN